jgi:uncharacterized protein HemX
MRSEYERVSGEFMSYKKQQQQNEVAAAVGMSPSTTTLASAATSTIAARLNLSPFSASSTSNSSYQLNQHQHQQQENESLEEDMRKAKESADMLRSVVLPLETEITTLRTRSNTSDQRIKELQRQLEEVNKERERGQSLMFYWEFFFFFF